MINVDTLKIYDDLKASGVPEAQAHAQAIAIAHANRVTPEDLAKLERTLIVEMRWMRAIGAAMTLAFLSFWFR